MPSLAARLLTGYLMLMRRRRVYGNPVPDWNRVVAAQSCPARPGPFLRRRCRVSRETRDGQDVYTVSADRTGSGPVVLYLHGGAYIRPITRVHWHFIGRLAVQLGATVVVPLYPLAPTRTCRTSVGFVLGLYRELMQRTDPVRVFVMGDSAGGGLALSLAMEAARESVAPAAGLVLLSPWLDVSVSDPSQGAIERVDPMLMREGLRAAGRAYAGDLPLDDPLASPLFGPLRGLPPILSFCGTHDILVSDIRRLAARADREQASLVLHEAPGLMHVYALLPLPEARVAREHIQRFVRGTITSKSGKPS